MADAIVGTWKGRPEDTIGVKEYYDAIGKPEEMAKMADANKPNTTVFRKVGDNSYKCEFTFDGWSTPIVDEIIIGGKRTCIFPGFGSVKMESAMEGNKIVSIGNAEGIEIKMVLYVEGSRLFWETIANGATMSGHSYKA